MSALGQTPKLPSAGVTSASPLKSDIGALSRRVRSGPILLKKSAIALGEIR
jgi:hypothetical protein